MAEMPPAAASSKRIVKKSWHEVRLQGAGIKDRLRRSRRDEGAPRQEMITKARIEALFNRTSRAFIPMTAGAFCQQGSSSAPVAGHQAGRSRSSTQTIERKGQWFCGGKT
jgi:hypothetical protein